MKAEHVTLILQKLTANVKLSNMASPSDNFLVFFTA